MNRWACCVGPVRGVLPEAVSKGIEEQLSGAWGGFPDEGKGDASRLGPLAGLEKQRTQYKAALDALSDPLRTRLILVARAQDATLREAARTHAQLAAIGLSQQYLVINGVLPASETAQDELAAAIFRREQAHRD